MFILKVDIILTLSLSLITLRPKDLLVMISLRGGSAVDFFTDRLILNDKLVIEFQSPDEKKLWLIFVTPHD
jgi:hypothetical protein